MEDSSLLRRKLAMLKDGLLDSLELADTIARIAHSDLINRDDVCDDLVNLVSHPDCDVRSEAMSALAYHGATFCWDIEPGRTLLRTLLGATDNDADSDCRAGAASALGSFFRGTHRREVMEMLAHVCLKPDEEKVVKAFAYVAFLDVIGMPKREQPSPFKIEVGEHELNQISEYLGGKNRG